MLSIKVLVCQLNVLMSTNMLRYIEFFISIQIRWLNWSRDQLKHAYWILIGLFPLKEETEIST